MPNEREELTTQDNSELSEKYEVSLKQITNLDEYVDLVNVLKDLADKGEVNNMRRQLVVFIQTEMDRVRLDELQNLGYDKRLDDPILYCGNSKPITREERIAHLQAKIGGRDGRTSV